MPDIVVDTLKRTMSAGRLAVPCVIGRGGAIPAMAKREGDGKTPLGRYPLRALLAKPGQGYTPETALPWRWLRENDGWCDAPDDAAYNRPVRLPHSASAERLWRDDGLYDLILVIGHNDNPPTCNMGSAIFIHCLAADGRATEGCVAIAKADLLAVVEAAAPGDVVVIR